MTDYEKLAILLSSGSLCISIFVLGWNVYRDVVLKARVSVRLQLSFIAHGEYKSPTKTSLAATNLGPGKIICSGIHAKVAPLWRRLLRRTEFAFIMPDYTDPYSSKLPRELNVGEVCNLFLPFDKDCFLAKPYTHIGIADTFGRYHWAPRRDVARVREEYRRRFCHTQSDRTDEPRQTRT